MDGCIRATSRVFDQHTQWYRMLTEITDREPLAVALGCAMVPIRGIWSPTYRPLPTKRFFKIFPVGSAPWELEEFRSIPGLGVMQVV